MNLRWLTFARGAWLVFALLVILLFVIGVPLRLRELLTVTPAAEISVGQLRPQDLNALTRFNLSIEIYAAYFTLVEMFVGLAFILVAFVIFWRRSDEWIGIFVATMLMFLTTILPIATAVQRAWISPAAISIFAIGGFGFFLTSFPFLFPDGRIVPRRARVIVWFWLFYMIGAQFYPSILPPTTFGIGIQPDEYLPMTLMLLTLGFGVGAQIYRYLRVSTLAQRQQTKWVVLGFGIGLACFCIGILLLVPTIDSAGEIDLAARLLGPTFILFGAVLIPISFGFSILRYRLWDIDILIRRTVTYSILTAILGAVYFGLVVVAQQLFRTVTGQNSEIAIIVSTLVIALMFVPLRRRIQDFLDRRFYRKKYDAQQVLAKFAQTARDETDIDKLTNELVRVVDETMQPESVSVWFKKESKKAKDRE